MKEKEVAAAAAGGQEERDSNKACPKCGSRATKRVLVNTGEITCQICDHVYYPASQDPVQRGKAQWWENLPSHQGGELGSETPTTGGESTLPGQAKLFRKKPVIITAEQFWGGWESLKQRGVCHKPECLMFGPHLHTMHDGQKVLLVPGDWIIPEPDGEHFYPCKPDVFGNTYDSLTSEGGSQPVATSVLKEKKSFALPKEEKR